MAASTDTTRIVIDLESRLRNLEKTLRGLEQLRKKLAVISRVGGTQTTAATDKATAAAQRLANQQQRLAIQSQELANRQERARQATERLALSSRRLEQAQQRATTATTTATRAVNAQQDAHVKAFRAMERASGQLNRNLLAVGNALRSVGQGLASVGATLTVSVTAPLLALGASVVDAAVRMDSLRRGLTTMAGSSQEAAIQLERLTQVAKLPGIGFEEAIQGSIRLQAVGFSAEEAERALRQFSNAIALTGGGRENLENVTVQLGQMAAQSKVLAQDLKPIISSAPAVAVALREAFGTVRSEELQELGVSSKEFIDILVRQLERLPRATAGARNSFENFRDEVFRAAATVGTTLLPALTRLAEVVGPVVVSLANAFAAIPAPLQVIIIAFSALLAVIGPIVFVVGQLTLGIGRLLVGFAELNAVGILPTVASLRALTAGTLGAAAAQRTLAASTALVAGGIGLLLTAITAVVAGFALYRAFQKDSVSLSREQANAITDQIKGLKSQLAFTNGLRDGVERTADEQARLADIYDTLNTQAKIRLTTITDEEKRLAALREELQKILRLRDEERLQQAANVAALLASTAAQLQDNQVRRDSIAAQVTANTQLAESLRASGRITREQAAELARLNLTGQSVADTIAGLERQNGRLIGAQDRLIKSADELNGTATEYAAILRTLGVENDEQLRDLLNNAKAMGLFRGNVEQALISLRKYTEGQKEATDAVKTLTETIKEQGNELRKAGNEADVEQKKRRTQIAAAAALAREASDSFEGALKFMRAFIAANPDLRTALERESRIAGKSFDDFVQESLEKAFGRGGRGERGETGLRNAQQQLADARAEVALAGKDREIQIEQEKNAELLRDAEVGQRLRILSYREYLELRANLTAASLDAEIAKQEEVARAAREAQTRLLAEANKAALPPAERTRRQAQAAGAEEEAIRAETRLIVLRRQRGRIDTELAQALKESQDQQLKDTRQLEIQYAELQGRIQDALNAAAVEEFREQLEDLGQAQEFLNRLIETARKLRQTEQLEAAVRQRDLNQRQIETINNTIRQRSALAELAAAEKLIENAKERQRQLEQDLRFQVEFRGLSEEESIRRRLEGERRLQASMELAKSIIEETRQALVDLGLTPPPDLTKFIDGLKTELKGLGELSLTEQFRLAEKEFNRLNDERLRRIADVERAVNNRNIAEVEGLLLIRRINGEYVGDLERQLALLQEIAARSGDASLQRQAQSAEETVKDANDRLADFNRQLRSTSIDALRDGFTEFFASLGDSTTTAKEKLLNLLNSVVSRINQVIAENLAEKLIESLFGDGKQGDGILAAIGRLFGIGGRTEGKGGITDVAGKATQEATGATAAATALTTGATTAASALTAGGTTAATALTAGGTTAGSTLITSMTAAASAFASAVIAAGAAFAAAVVAASASQAIGGIGSAAGGAATGLFPAVPGGMYRIVEGGYPEAVITTDPRHAARQVSILRELIARTKGFYGRVQVPDLAIGGIVSRETAEANLLSSINRAPSFTPRLSDTAHATAGGGGMSLRIVNQVESRALTRPYINSEEGVRDIMNIISANSNHVVRRLRR